MALLVCLPAVVALFIRLFGSLDAGPKLSCPFGLIKSCRPQVFGFWISTLCLYPATFIFIMPHTHTHTKFCDDTFLLLLLLFRWSFIFMLVCSFTHTNANTYCVCVQLCSIIQKVSSWTVDIIFNLPEKFHHNWHAHNSPVLFLF